MLKSYETDDTNKPNCNNIKKLFITLQVLLLSTL